MSASSEPDAIAENARTLEQLRSLVAGLDDAAMRRELGGGWTVGVALAHLAFWDRISAERWQAWVRGGQMEDLQGATDLVNDAAVFQWRALGPSAVRTLVLDAAVAVNEAVASGGTERVQAVTAAGKPRWARRHIHRAEHLAQIEAALRDARERRRP
jgi:hypothetical protein